jgi:hypothetical protein
LGISLIAGTPANDNRECIKYAPPTPTPIPPERIYSEWIPMPGSSAGMGKGWINARELKNGAFERSHRVLTDKEYHAIELAHGMRQSRGSRYGETLWGYGFPPRIDFNTLYGGVILKNEWLPERLK